MQQIRALRLARVQRKWQFTRAKSTRHTPPAAAAYRKPPTPAPPNAAPVKDPARGYEASMRVAQGGKLDPHYRGAARRVLAIIVATPFAIVLGWKLFERQVLGVEQRKLPDPVKKENDENMIDVGDIGGDSSVAMEVQGR